MVTGKCTGDELRRRHRFGLQRIGEPEGEGEEGEVREDRELTLSAWVCSAVAEEGRRQRNRGGGRRSEAEKTEMNASM